MSKNTTFVKMFIKLDVEMPLEIVFKESFSDEHFHKSCILAHSTRKKSNNQIRVILNEKYIYKFLSETTNIKAKYNNTAWFHVFTHHFSLIVFENNFIVFSIIYSNVSGVLFTKVKNIKLDVEMSLKILFKDSFSDEHFHKSCILARKICVQ
jgi:hypothetical protein